MVNQISGTILFEQSHLKLYSNDRFSQLMDFIEDHFYPDETLSKAVGVVPKEDVIDLWKFRLRNNISLLLVSDATGEIIGAVTMMIISRKPDPSCAPPVITSEKVRKVRHFLDNVRGVTDIFSHFGVDDAIHIITIAVHREHRGQGISSKLLRSALMFCKDIGVIPVCVDAAGTSKCSQHLFEKCDFDNLGVISLKDLGAENECVKFYAKRL